MTDNMRVRDWGVKIGKLEAGEKNSITDIPGIRVGHCDVVFGEGPLEKGTGPARTGVTAIWPASGNVFTSKVPAATHVINGHGKSIGLMQINELGNIETPIMITNTLNVGAVADALIEYLAFKKDWDFSSINPIVAECNDGFLSDILGRHVKKEHVFAALDNATDGPVDSSCSGAGNGMSCYHFKGGIGSASRKLEFDGKTYHVGSLVCSNMGGMHDLRIDGMPVGITLEKERDNTPELGSIIMLLATDAPLDSRQLGRLALRATHGLARTGTASGNGSGDTVYAWSTANRVPSTSETSSIEGERWLDAKISSFFRAAADCTEEAILDSMWTAKTVIGRDGNARYKIPLESVRKALEALNYTFE
jgi:D-aminopeptidase